jgi:alpha-tubulin suppressor-like RCC1 family protein
MGAAAPAAPAAGSSSGGAPNPAALPPRPPQVYAWGHNSAGQLGLGDRRDRHAPTVVDALWALPVVQLAAGDAHSAALTTNGHMFIWGSNHFGQLGLLRDGDPASSRARKT